MAARTRIVDIIRLLIHYNGKVKLTSSELLTKAVQLNNIELVRYLLALPDIDVNTRDKHGDTLLHICKHKIES